MPDRNTLRSKEELMASLDRTTRAEDLKVRNKEELLASLKSPDREKRKAALGYLKENKDPELYIYLLKNGDRAIKYQVTAIMDPQKDKDLALRVIAAMTTADHGVLPAIAQATDVSASLEVSRALMDHPDRSGANVLMRKIGPNTSMILTCEYLNSPDPNVRETIAKNVVKDRAVELAPVLMSHPQDATVRFWGTQLIDQAATSDLLKQGLGSGYRDVQQWVAAKVPTIDPLFSDIQKKFPAIAAWRRGIEAPTDLSRPERVLS